MFFLVTKKVHQASFFNCYQHLTATGSRDIHRKACAARFGVDSSILRQLLKPKKPFARGLFPRTVIVMPKEREPLTRANWFKHNRYVACNGSQCDVMGCSRGRNRIKHDRITLVCDFGASVYEMRIYAAERSTVILISINLR